MQCSVGTNGVANVTKITYFFPFLRTYTEDSLREALKQVINDYLGVSVSFNVIKADFGQPVRKSTSAVVLPKASSETALPISSTGNSKLNHW